MSNKITFYHNPMSRGRIVHWMLEEVGAEYDVKLLSFEKKETKRPEYLAINPMGKIPAIVHRGNVITECAAICAYLGDAFPEKKLAPALEDPQRGPYLRWFFFGAGCLEPAIIDKMLKRDCDRPSALGYGSYEDTLNALETALKPGPFILGKQFSAVDVYIASQIAFGMLMVKALEPRPIFKDYLARCTDRPAYVRCEEQTKALG